DFTPRITVIGVGGGGTNAVNNMIATGLDGVEFVVANTDAQALLHSRAKRRVQLGAHLTQGLGAGAKPEIGRAAAEEATEELTRHLDGSHMVFITAGMGGGTGTGAAPVIARMARELGVLTVGVVTKPFDFEGIKRRRASDAGLEELQQFVDTLIVIPNQNLFRIANERTTFAEAFKMADNVLHMGVRGVTDLMVKPGVVNLDFADIRTVMAEMGKAMMGTGEAEGDDRAVKAAEAAISNPLLEDTSLRGARGVLINITGGLDMTLFEVDEAANRIRKEVDEDANIIFGSSVEEDLNGRLRVSVVATGIDAAVSAAQPAQGAAGQTPAAAPRPETLTLVPGSRPAALARAPVMSYPSGPLAAPRRAAGGGGPMVLRAQVSPAAVASSPVPLGPVAMSSPEDAAAAAASGQVSLPNGAPAEPVRRNMGGAAASTVPGVSNGIRRIFQEMTGAGLMRRNPHPAEQPPSATPRSSDTARPSGASVAQRLPQPEEIGLDIPTFLRRQSN
ncbi:MAG TPA: cell division protein FtsZ, partial [Acetobacteraceae bacterium]|nr:cell division protein FtsZ [Acetobacteraceae bacterium]